MITSASVILMRVMRKSSRSQIDRLTPLHCALAGGRVRQGRPEPMLNLKRIPGASQVWFFNVFESARLISVELDARSV